MNFICFQRKAYFLLVSSIGYPLEFRCRFSHSLTDKMHVTSDRITLLGASAKFVDGLVQHGLPYLLLVKIIMQPVRFGTFHQSRYTLGYTIVRAFEYLRCSTLAQRTHGRRFESFSKPNSGKHDSEPSCGKHCVVE